MRETFRTYATGAGRCMEIFPCLSHRENGDVDIYPLDQPGLEPTLGSGILTEDLG